MSLKLLNLLPYQSCTKSLYKLQLVQEVFVQVATCTRLALQAVPCTEFHHQINPIFTILL